MEILQKFKENGYFTADLYHLLSKKKIVDTQEVIIPSEYEREMKLSAQERLDTLHKIELANIVGIGSNNDHGRVILDFAPRVLVFQNFKPNEKVTAKFSVKNISKAPTYLNMIYKESSYFVVKPVGGKLLSRLAPGISVTFTVTFHPVQYVDYAHKVTFSTDRDQYVLAFFAMGPRPMFDFPDEIVVPPSPLKVESHATVLVQNVGFATSGFKLDTRTPFAVQPKSVYLNPKEKIEIRTIAKTMHQGRADGALFALFETGEIFKIRLTGSTFPVTIQLEKQVVRFLDTYKTMVRQQTYKIFNKSEHVLTYSCMKHEDVYQDFEEKVKLAHIFYHFKEHESAKCQKLVYYDVLTSEEHDRVYTRIFFDQIHSLIVDETLHFQDTHFSISPIKGKLWPNKATELTITFNPQAIGDFKAVAYMDMDGMRNRVPLTMQGTSLPPEIVLNLETLDMDRVYINKKYNFEIVAMNKGHINGMIVYKDLPTLFGSHVSCTPAMRCLRSGEQDIFAISFSNSNQGPFFEEINFVITDSDVVLKLYLKGEVIYPSLMFSIPSLDFGTVSLGVPKTLELEIINESIVNVNASVKISSDGPEVSSIKLIDYAVVDMPKPKIPQWPREFDIKPAVIDMAPESRVTLKVTLTANLIRANQTYLELELEKSDSPPIILPVTFDARVPTINPAPDIKLRGCFLDFPYQYVIQVKANEIHGYYTLEEMEDEQTLEVVVGNKEGFIEPLSTLSFPVTIKTCFLGVQEHTIRLNLFGSSAPVDICHILLCGVRPIVTCSPMALYWGQVKLLTRTRKTLTLCNDSPVAVCFRASVLNRDGRWQIQPTEGYIEPEGETDLCVSLYLVDADTYVNKAVIQLERVKDILIPLSVTGVGTSITVGELRDRVVLGRNFTNIRLNSVAVMENRGTRMHTLEWSEHYKAPKGKPTTAAFFNLEPRLFKMAAGEKMDLTITGISHKVATVKEMWYLVGSVEGINKKELLLECEIVAEFVDPKLEVSTSLLEFRYDFGPYSEYYKLTEIVTIKNVSKLPLDMEISVKVPFTIIKKSDTYKITPEDADKCSCICYRESDLDVSNILKTSRERSRIFIDYLTLKPVEPLRKGPLNFFEDINKIKMAFNFTQNVEERLEDQEIMKLQVLFDTTYHTNLKSRIYNDLMRMKFQGHKNKDAVRIIGRINFPNILVITPKIDFQCIRNGSIKSKAIKIENPTPLLVCFKFQWKKSIITSNIMKADREKRGWIPWKIIMLKDEKRMSVEMRSDRDEQKEELLRRIQINGHLMVIGNRTMDMCDKNHLCAVYPGPEIPELKLSYKDADFNTSSYYGTDLQSSHPRVGDIQEIMSSGYRAPFHSPECLDNIDEKTSAPYAAAQKDQVSESVPVLSEPEESLEVTATDIIRKICPMMAVEHERIFPWSWKFGKETQESNRITNNILQLCPFKGILKPNGSQEIYVIFNPSRDINVKAILECEVLGGPSETISVMGQSSDLKYNINSHKLNFKIRSFHESATEILTITNIARLGFEYKTYLNEPKFENELNGSILGLEPAENTVEPEQTTDMRVVMRPGVLGYFHRVFLLEIGHLPHVPIEVFGWGVIPQVYISLPRPDIVQLHPEIGYQAIPTLTEEYLGAISEIFIFPSKNANSPITERCFDDPDLQNNWHICSQWDVYPSNMDIELAIERMLLVDHIKLRPDILLAYSTKSKTGPIPGFLTTPYVIDFGVVITGNTVQCTIEVINYGPIVIKLHFAKPVHFPTWLGVKLCGKLNPGETGKLDITFSPTPEDFIELEQDVEASFKIEVPYGVTIPVKMKALCAVPYLATNVDAIDFGSVRCGNKIISTISLKNVGKPSCIWYVTLRLKTTGSNPMTVLNSSGRYEPGEGGWLSIAFKPIEEMVYEGQLLFRFHMNPRKMAIPIRGAGILPQVHIIGPQVSFPPTLPWAETADIYFGITNPCPFPLELIFAHCDENWNQEEEIYQLLYKYYNKPEEMLVPAITPGLGMHREIVDFYTDFTQRVKRAVEAELASARAANANNVSARKAAKTPKSAKIQPSPKSPADTAAGLKKFRTEAEIITDEIKELKENGCDPLKECIESIYESSSTSSALRAKAKGLIVFVHGSPGEETQAQEVAYTFGMKLDIPTVNIDLCFVEALCCLDTTARNSIVNVINEAYEAYKRNIAKEDTVKEEGGSEEAESEVFDEFDAILNKIILLASNKNVTTPRSKSTEKKKKDKEATSLEGLGSTSTTMFQQDYTIELLTDFFALPKFKRGFVIDSLTSFVITQPSVLLTTILRCKHTIQNVHLILFQSEFKYWAQAYEESFRDNDLLDETIDKVYEESEIAEILKMIDEADGDEFEQLNPEFKSIYVTYGLEERRRKHKEKTDAAARLLPTSEVKPGSGKVQTPDLRSSDSKKKITKRDDRVAPNKTSEYMTMLGKYNEYTKTTYDSLVTVAANWIFEECNTGFPLYGLNGQLLGSVQKKAKVKSETQVVQASDANAERGFPLTLVMCPCLHYKKALVNVFLNAPIIQEALKEDTEPNGIDILQLPMKTKEYTVLLPKTMPHIRHELPLKWCFLEEVPVQSSSTSTHALPPLVPDIEKVNSEEREPDFYPFPLLNMQEQFPEKRIVLEPGDLLRCKYSYSPQWEGHVSIERFVEVSGWPKSRLAIHISGVCDLPRIDSRPKKMFGNFVRRSNFEDNVYKVTYLDDQDLFEFGPIFVGQNRVYEEEYTIDLKNASLITTNIDIEFANETKVFEVDKSFISLEPGCRGKLTITAAPAEVGVHQGILLFCVKDNPEIVSVVIQCSGVVPSVEILPLTKIIDYGKLLLYRREDDRFIVKNDSLLPIMWKVRNADEFVEDFIIAQTSGIVPRNDNQVVPVTYIACRVDVISHKIMIIDIYDEQGRGTPMLVSQLQLSAECYDVMIECAYEDPADNCLNYGNVKVNSTESRQMYLMNRGKYNVYYKLKKVKNFPEPSLLKTFEISPECGVIPCNSKLVIVDFTCTPATSINLTNVPVYTCSLLDGSKRQVVVAKFPVYITIASFYNTFTLFPLGELNFNIIAIGTSITKEVILTNTSKCPVTYEIVLPEEYQPKMDALPSPLKLKDNKIRNPPLKCGNFLIMNEANLIEPGTSRIINIQFTATGAGMFKGVINFIISDTCPAEASGVPLRLVGIGAMPTLDFWNIENTFREHLIVKNLADYKVPETSPHCVFVENSVTLHFFCTNVNTSFAGAIDLYNNGLVACALSMKLINQQNTSYNNVFSLDKYDTHIEPLQHKSLRINFSPKALEEYRAVLEIRLNLLNNQQQSFKVCLIGEGVIPRIQMLSPQTKQNKLSFLQMPVTCLGSVNSREIQFRNISTVISIVVLMVEQATYDERPIFWLTAADISKKNVINSRIGENDVKLKLRLNPHENANVVVHYNPVKRGKTSCEIHLMIVDNAYEYFTVFCEAEGFMEDVILIGLEMLSMDIDVTTIQTEAECTESTVSSTVDSKKKNLPKKKDAKGSDTKKRTSMSSAFLASEMSCLKYLLDFGGCELRQMQKRGVVMVNNSEKVYKFIWETVQYVVVNPSVGYISPGEEKDLEIVFFTAEPVVVKKAILNCNLSIISDDTLTLDTKGATWDSRQTVTTFDHNKENGIVERTEETVDEMVIGPSEATLSYNNLKMLIMYSATAECTKFTHTLKEEIALKDTFIYQTRQFDFKVSNTGKVPMKISWCFQIDEEFPTRIDKKTHKKHTWDGKSTQESDSIMELPEADAPSPPCYEPKDTSKETLFSRSLGRGSVDTWFEINLPFRIEPSKKCIKPNKNQVFTVTFAPVDAFDYKVLLMSSIDNLDPQDRNVFCKITAKSLIPYCHLDIEESDYLTSGRRKETGVALPNINSVLEFNVLGSGCYTKAFNVINPTNESYEFTFEMMMSDKPELIPVHCNMLKGYVEGGTSCEVIFTFAPSTVGVYESLWKFTIPLYDITMDVLVVGLAREPEALFVPTILTVRNSLVGFTITDTVMLVNNEHEMLKFEFKGNSLLNESGKTPVVMEPSFGTLKPRSETPIKFIYTPIDDGPLSFKIFCAISYMTKYLTLCVNTLSHSIRPKVTYFLIGNEHILDSKAITNIHLDQTASTYTRTLTFVIKNDGSATFFYEWSYNTVEVKKYLVVTVEPRSGHVAPANQVECTLSFTLKQVPVEAFPVTLYILDGPEYKIFLHSEIEKPMYHFSSKEIDFGKCVINAPDSTYKKILTFMNDDRAAILLALDFETLPELLVDYKQLPKIESQHKVKVKIFFRPKQVKEYEFKIKFWVNSLCEEIVTVKGEGVKCLFDLYEGCEKSFDMGPVKVGSKIIRQIEVMNHSKVAIDATFIFKTMYPEIEDSLNSEATSVCDPTASSPTLDRGPSRTQMVKNYNDDKVRNQIAMDIQNALSSLKVIPKECRILPYRKVPLKIQFKPVGMISNLDVQLNMLVLNMEKPLVRLSGSATGMSLCLSQDSVQFGRVRVRGCKVLKVMLLNKGDFGARFWWQPLMSDEFTISPMYGHIAAHTNVTFTITYRPKSHNPFVKIWASCNIENYVPLELAIYAACLDTGDVQTKTVYLECPAREVATSYVPVTNPTDGLWLVVSEMPSGPGPFSTLTEFNIEPNSVFDIPVFFKPKTMGRHEAQLLYTNLGEGALFVSLLGVATPPNPNGLINITVPAKDIHTEELKVHHITESPETYTVSTEIVKIVPDKFDAFYEVKHTETVKVWGETFATCRWDYACYGECEMHMKVVFVNKATREYQFYEIVATVTASEILDTLTMTSRARETVSRELVVKNPLSIPATFTVHSQQLECPSSIDIGRQSQAPLLLSYSPLVVGQSEEFLEICNNLVGTYVYKMILKCLPAKEKEMEIETPIGTRAPMRLRVQNRSDVKTSFTTTVSHPSILADKEYYLGPSEKGKFLVWFEPIDVGVQRCRVSFNSPTAGEFIYNIKGRATIPKPQGPLEIKAGGYTTITFRNVFMDTRKFKIIIDRQEFYIKSPMEPVPSKKEAKVVVYLSEQSAWGVSVPTGCLTIETLEPPEPAAQWTYFLQGVP